MYYGKEWKESYGSKRGRERVKGTTKWDASTECIPDGVVNRKRAWLVHKLPGSPKPVDFSQPADK